MEGKHQTQLKLPNNGKYRNFDGKRGVPKLATLSELVTHLKESKELLPQVLGDAAPKEDPNAVSPQVGKVVYNSTNTTGLVYADVDVNRVPEGLYTAPIKPPSGPGLPKKKGAKGKGKGNNANAGKEAGKEAHRSKEAPQHSYQNVTLDGNGNRVEIVETGQTRAPSVPYAVIRPGEIAPPVHRAQEVAEDGDNYEAIAPAQDAQGTNDAPPSTSYSHLSTASGQDQGDDRSHYNALARPRTDSNPVDHTYEDYSHQPNVAEMRAAAKLKRETEAGQPKERQRCGRGPCMNREQKKDEFMVCGGCEVIAYCSPECQTKDWGKTHAKICKQLKAEQAQGVTKNEIKKKYMQLQDEGGAAWKVPMGGKGTGGSNHGRAKKNSPQKTRQNPKKNRLAGAGVGGRKIAADDDDEIEC